MIFKDVENLCGNAALILEISIICITLRGEFKDLRDGFQNLRTFQGHSKIFPKIQGPFKDFKDQYEAEGFQGFFQGCGNPVYILTMI